MDLYQIFKEFREESDCHAYLIKLRWPDGVRCVYCGSSQVYARRTGHRFKCGCCNKSFSVTVGTIFHSTKLPLSKWFIAIAQILSAKKGLSSLQLARVVRVNKDTAWFMQLRIRSSMKTDEILSRFDDHTMCFPDAKVALRKDNTKQHIKFRTRKSRNNEAPNKMTVTTRKHQISVEELLNPGYFALLQRAVIGQYHRLSERYLTAYKAEIVFKRVYRGISHFDLALHFACAVRWEMRV